jgi:(1->4)-alpha-D-glucan 1-alpha-D-glucosylmutase
MLADLDADGPAAPAAAPAADPAAADPAAADPLARLDVAKLLVTSRVLRLRRDHPDWFAGSYTPLAAVGSAAGHVVAFARGGHAITMATRLPVGLRSRGGWADTALAIPTGLPIPTGLATPTGFPIPAKGWVDVLTGSRYSGQRVPLSELTRRLPVALLVPEE